MTARIKGALAPVLTPFDRSLEPDTKRFVAHCKWIVSQGVPEGEKFSSDN